VNALEFILMNLQGEIDITMFGQPVKKLLLLFGREVSVSVFNSMEDLTSLELIPYAAAQTKYGETS